MYRRFGLSIPQSQPISGRLKASGFGSGRKRRCSRLFERSEALRLCGCRQEFCSFDGFAIFFGVKASRAEEARSAPIRRAVGLTHSPFSMRQTESRVHALLTGSPLFGFMPTRLSRVDDGPCKNGSVGKSGAMSARCLALRAPSPTERGRCSELGTNQNSARSAPGSPREMIDDDDAEPGASPLFRERQPSH